MPAGTPSIVPLLFVTIACGAISGFHGMVASSTTSKQLDKETDARFVGYFGAVGEGMLSLAAIICCTAGFATLVDWQAVYSSFGGGNVTAFVNGGEALIGAGLGLPQNLGSTLLATMAILFAATTMDTGLRLQRFVVQEAAELAGFKVGTLLGTVLALGVCMALAFGAGSGGSGGMVIWPLFGTTNQLLAALTLAIITVILIRKGRNPWFTGIPMVFLLIMSVYALVVQLGTFYNDGNWLLLGMDIVILIAALWVTFEAALAMRQGRDGGDGTRDVAEAGRG